MSVDAPWISFIPACASWATMRYVCFHCPDAPRLPSRATAHHKLRYALSRRRLTCVGRAGARARKVGLQEQHGGHRKQQHGGTKNGLASIARAGDLRGRHG
eukprot:346199-Pleurochrysis_carterae.AAC.1